MAAAGRRPPGPSAVPAVPDRGRHPGARPAAAGRVRHAPAARRRELEFGRAGRTARVGLGPAGSGGWPVVFAGPLGAAGHPLLRPPDPTAALRCPGARRSPGQPGDRATCPGRFASAVHRAVKRGGYVLVPRVRGGRRAAADDAAGSDGRPEIPRLPVLLDSPAGPPRSPSTTGPCRGLARLRLDGLGGVRLPEPRRTALGERSHVARGRTLDHRRRAGDGGRGPGAADISPPCCRTAQQCRPAGGTLRVREPARRCWRPRQAAQDPRALRAGPGRGDRVGRHRRVRRPAQAEAWATARTAAGNGLVVESEPEPSHALANSLHAERGWCAVVPDDGERVLL